MLPSVHLHSRRLSRILAASFLALATGGLAALPVLSAPASLRQGEPLLVRLSDPRSLSGCRVELRSPSGALVDSTGLFEWGQTPALAPHLYGALFAIDMAAEPGTYRVVVTGFEGSQGGKAGVEPAGAPPSSQASAGPASAGMSQGGQAAAIPVVPAIVAAAPGLAFTLEYRFAVQKRDFFSEDIPLDPVNTAIRTAPDPRKEAEAKALYALLDQVDSGAVWLDEAFRFPVDAMRRTAGFGDRRRYVYAKGGTDTSVHAGIDIGVPRGTPVMACGAGRVVFAGDRIVTGKTIIIEHLPGLYSLYMHLDAIKVVQGGLVARGGLIGLSGSTGLSTGPHLHWELRLRGRAVDPDYWVTSPLVDKGQAISKMEGLMKGGDFY
jgi:murein DD-endopeptidase MepM/ murein hydrolase activator NlpD